MQFTKRATGGGGNGGAYVKLEPGGSITGVLRGEAFEFFQIWPKGGDKQVFDTRVPGAISRFKANLIVFEGGKFVAKIWEFSLNCYNQLADYGESVDLETTKIRISRPSAQKTAYSVVPVLKEPLTKKQLAEIDAIELLPLSSGAGSPAPVGKFESEVETSDDSGEVPF